MAGWGKRAKKKGTQALSGNKSGGGNNLLSDAEITKLATAMLNQHGQATHEDFEAVKAASAEDQKKIWKEVDRISSAPNFSLSSAELQEVQSLFKEINSASGKTTNGYSNPYYEAEPKGSHGDVPTLPGHPALAGTDVTATYNKISQLTGVSDLSKVEKMVFALSDYTGTSYKAIRKDEFDGKKTPTTIAINEYLQKMPAYKGTIYRGIGFGDYKSFKARLEEIENGNFEIQAMSSFSSDRKIANKFASGGAYGFDPDAFQIVYRVKENKSGRSVRSVSTNRGEDEVLVPKGVQYRVKKISPTKGDFSKVVIDLEEFAL